MIENNPLFDYIHREDPHFSFEILETKETEDAHFYDIEFTSQEWKGILWKHRLALTIPRKSRYPEVAFLMIGADFPFYIEHSAIGNLYSEQSGVACAFLYDIPNQPLFEDKVEDELIAYTLDQYLETGDADWILLGPMTKSALRAMDAVQKIHGIRAGWGIEKFVLNGASKRGWTTWLAAAADRRIAGIAPQVFDNLNIEEQMPHQMKVFENYSEMIADYTERNLPEKMKTPRGKLLTAMVDPYSYREELTIPKVILNAVNDPYWATDASSFYFNALSGENRMCFAPNCGHGYNDTDRLNGALLGLIHSVGSGLEMPDLPEYDIEYGDGEVTLSIVTSAQALEARVWVAESLSQDFRKSVWNEMKMIQDEDEKLKYNFEFDLSKTANTAFFGEVVFAQEPFPFRITTKMFISSLEV